MISVSLGIRRISITIICASFVFRILTHIRRTKTASQNEREEHEPCSSPSSSLELDARKETCSPATRTESRFCRTGCSFASTARNQEAPGPGVEARVEDAALVEMLAALSAGERDEVSYGICLFNGARFLLYCAVIRWSYFFLFVSWVYPFIPLPPVAAHS